jgi:thioredoxin 1
MKATPAKYNPLPNEHIKMNRPTPQKSLKTSPQPTRSRFLRYWRWFWLVTLVVSLAYAWYCFYVPANSIAWAPSLTAAHHQSLQTGKPIILFFTGDWCVPCRIMKRNVWADQQVAASVHTRFIAVTINIDDADGAEARSRYGVGATPATIITNPQGTVLQRRDGGMSKADFLEFMGKLHPPAASVLP